MPLGEFQEDMRVGEGLPLVPRGEAGSASAEATECGK
jgi:hypothetical protein